MGVCYVRPRHVCRAPKGANKQMNEFKRKAPACSDLPSPKLAIAGGDKGLVLAVLAAFWLLNVLVSHQKLSQLLANPIINPLLAWSLGALLLLSYVLDVFSEVTINLTLMPTLLADYFGALVMILAVLGLVVRVYSKRMVFAGDAHA